MPALRSCRMPFVCPTWYHMHSLAPQMGIRNAFKMGFEQRVGFRKLRAKVQSANVEFSISRFGAEMLSCYSNMLPICIQNALKSYHLLCKYHIKHACTTQLCNIRATYNPSRECSKMRCYPRYGWRYKSKHFRCNFQTFWNAVPNFCVHTCARYHLQRCLEHAFKEYKRCTIILRNAILVIT